MMSKQAWILLNDNGINVCVIDKSAWMATHEKVVIHLITVRTNN